MCVREFISALVSFGCFDGTGLMLGNCVNVVFDLEFPCFLVFALGGNSLERGKFSGLIYTIKFPQFN